MPSVLTDRLEPSSSARGARASDAVRARAADRLAGRTVWCATALPAGRGTARTLRGCLTADGCVIAQDLEVTPDEPFRSLAERLDQALRLAGAIASPIRARASGRFGRREEAMYAEGARDAEALARGPFGLGDVVVLHDAVTAALAEVVRGLGAHAVWEVNLGATPGPHAAGAAWDFLRRQTAAADALVMSWTEPGEQVERIVGVMPSAGLVATKEIPATGPDAERLRNRAWSTLLADIVDHDRGECVGGTLHARPTVPVR